MDKQKEFLNSNPNWTSAMILIKHCMDNEKYSPELRAYYKNLFNHGIITALKTIEKFRQSSIED